MLKGMIKISLNTHIISYIFCYFNKQKGQTNSSNKTVNIK